MHKPENQENDENNGDIDPSSDEVKTKVKQLRTKTLNVDDRFRRNILIKPEVKKPQHVKLSYLGDENEEVTTRVELTDEKFATTYVLQFNQFTIHLEAVEYDENGTGVQDIYQIMFDPITYILNLDPRISFASTSMVGIDIAEGTGKDFSSNQLDTPPSGVLDNGQWEELISDANKMTVAKFKELETKFEEFESTFDQLLL